MRNFIIILMAASVLLGCSIEIGKDDEISNEASQENKEKQEAILNFINKEVKKTSDLELEAFQSLYSVSGDNYTDDQTVYHELVNTTIPAYEKAVKEAKNIDTEIPELKKMAEQNCPWNRNFS
ncbi:hypothetical protein J9303_19670 [Bacillaceae bacterium Marseille-Q3522]|nr:hypothetical protein [Bacillaceae bacterium Marseille-Q3522]